MDQLKQEAALRYDHGKLRWDLLPFDALEELVKVYTFGAKKYQDHNWAKGMSWSRCMGSFFRHMVQRMKGEIYDEESGLRHTAHMTWNVLTLLAYDIRSVGGNDLDVSYYGPAFPKSATVPVVLQKPVQVPSIFLPCQDDIIPHRVTTNIVGGTVDSSGKVTLDDEIPF